MAEASGLYLNVVTRINDDYAALLDHLTEMDTRAAYLKTFEISLSQALREPLWSLESYKAQAARLPMPADPYAFLPFETFRSWIVVYEMVMRENGLIGRQKVAVLGLEEGV